MSDDDSEAHIENPRRFALSPVWLIPLAAALIGCWLLYQTIASQGPRITLRLDTAEGLEAGQTLVKVRNVEVGHVDSVRLTDDYNGAIATIQMGPDTQKLLVADTEFWVVKPRVGRQGISGLGTILSGAYIRLQPGARTESERRFVALNHPPVPPAGTPGVSITLASDGDNPLNVGDPVIYQGQTVGQIEAAEFSAEDKRMSYQVFIEAPFDQIVTQATQFWLRSGIDFHIGADGVDIQTGSLQAIFAGGVTFGLPGGLEPGPVVQDGAAFELYATRNVARQDRFDEQIAYVILLDDSVRGLSVGAPVAYRGIRVGTVLQVPFFHRNFNLDEFSGFRIPVLIAIEPQRISGWIDWPTPEWQQNLERFFENGLRASIKSGNFLTGAMFISLQFDDNASDYDLRTLGDYPVFPSQPGSFSNIQQQISTLLDKINELEVGQFVSELKRTLAAVEAATRNLNQIFATESAQSLPQEIQRTLAELRGTLSAYQEGAPVYQELNESLQRLNRVLDDVEPLAETLRDDPNALIFGPSTGRDPVPRAAP